LFSILTTNTGYTSPNPNEDEDMKEESFFSTWGDAKFSRPFPSAYAYTANLLVELVCPECSPVCPWPDEDFLKYTIERFVTLNSLRASINIKKMLLLYVSEKKIL